MFYYMLSLLKEINNIENIMGYDYKKIKDTDLALEIHIHESMNAKPVEMIRKVL